MTLDYPNGVGANVHISWLDPLKVRRMTVVGSEKMVVYDDVDPDARIVLYDKGVTRHIERKDLAASSLGRYVSTPSPSSCFAPEMCSRPEGGLRGAIEGRLQHFVDRIGGWRQARH